MYEDDRILLFQRRQPPILKRFEYPAELAASKLSWVLKLSRFVPAGLLGLHLGLQGRNARRVL